MAELLFWPRCSPTARRRSPTPATRGARARLGRLATWGVRLGWLAQTALLVAQAARADGFPWATWAGSLNLFVWLVVGAYLIWGCRAALPAARPRGDAARGRAARRSPRLGGGTGGRARSDYSNRLPRRSTSASCSPRSPASRSPRRSSALYLWQERRLKRHERRRSCACRAPSLVTLDDARRADDRSSRCRRSRSGSPSGSSGCASDGGSVDALMAVTLAHLGASTPPTSSCATRPAGAAAAPPTSRSPASRSSSSSGSASR